MTDSWIRSSVSAVLLAAGLSSRMGGGRDKLLLPCGEKTLLERAVGLLDSLDFHEKILVTTPERLAGLALPAGVRAILNTRPQNGQSESLRLGVSAATGKHYLFLMADQPLLTPAELRRLLECARENPGKIVYPCVMGAPASPALFPDRFRGELLELSGDTGGRAVREAHPGDCLALEFDAANPCLDVDSWADYEALPKSCRE